MGGLTPSDGGSDGGDAATTIGPWTELAKPVISVQGGAASQAGGVGQAGGSVHLVSVGDVSIDPSLPQVSAPAVPTVPGNAMPLASGALTADVSTGTIDISGTVMAGGPDAVRAITSSGDIFIDGTLQGADLGGGRQGFKLTATSGTVYITGTIDTSGANMSGQAGGPITITARAVVITGKVLSSGGSSPSAGGAAGAITIVTSGAFTSTGTIQSFGGNSVGGGGTAGGAAADLAITAGGDTVLAGTVLLRGGAAASSSVSNASGGAAANLRIDADGALTLGGTVDARGGIASAMSAGATVTAGAAGSIHIGESAPPTQIALLVPVDATGGDGDQAGGKGGSFIAEPNTGNLNVAGAKAVDVSGGGSSSAPGVGGQVTGGPRADPGSGGLHVSGDILANGGSIRKGGMGNGADAGRVDYQLKATDGPVMIDATGTISTNGGNSGGTGVAGGGGHIWLFTKDGDLTIAGKLSTRGGDAPDPGGTGGGGGMVYLFSDNNHNALNSNKGNLLVDTTGVVDSSGGNGDKGGSARSDGVKWSYATFPINQEQFAIFFNCDGVHGETMNWMENRGHLIARGGVHNGNGGDVVYHGIGPGQRGAPLDPGQSQHHPPPGNQDLSGDGTGMSGDYGGE